MELNIQQIELNMQLLGEQDRQLNIREANQLNLDISGSVATKTLHDMQRQLESMSQLLASFTKCDTVSHTSKSKVQPATGTSDLTQQQKQPTASTIVSVPKNGTINLTSVPVSSATEPNEYKNLVVLTFGTDSDLTATGEIQFDQNFLLFPHQLTGKTIVTLGLRQSTVINGHFCAIGTTQLVQAKQRYFSKRPSGAVHLPNIDKYTFILQTNSMYNAIKQASKSTQRTLFSDFTLLLTPPSINAGDILFQKHSLRRFTSLSPPQADIAQYCSAFRELHQDNKSLGINNWHFTDDDSTVFKLNGFVDTTERANVPAIDMRLTNKDELMEVLPNGITNGSSPSNSTQAYHSWNGFNWLYNTKNDLLIAQPARSTFGKIIFILFPKRRKYKSQRLNLRIQHVRHRYIYQYRYPARKIDRKHRFHPPPRADPAKSKHLLHNQFLNKPLLCKHQIPGIESTQHQRSSELRQGNLYVFYFFAKMTSILVEMDISRRAECLK